MSRRLVKEAYNKVAGLVKRIGGAEEFPILEGHPIGRGHAEEAVETHQIVSKESGKVMKKDFKIYRWSPNHPNRKPFLQSYFVDLSTCGPMVLDVLQRIKAEDDSTLCYRRSCREGICGSCSMNIDGINTVACLKPVDVDISKPTYVLPLPHMFVIKDLVVDLTNFYQQYKSIEPWLKTRKPPKDGREYRQSPEDRKKLDGLYECILFYMSAYYVLVVAVHALPIGGTPKNSLAQRLYYTLTAGYLTDLRVQALTEDESKLYNCRTIKNCVKACPKSLNPASAINKMKTRHLLAQPVERRVESL